MLYMYIIFHIFGKINKALNLDSFKAGLLPSDKLNTVEDLKKNSKAVILLWLLSEIKEAK